MIELRKMTEAEYDVFLKSSLPNYAEEKMRAEGLSKEQAWKVAQDSFDKLLPQRTKTENQFLFSIVESGSVIGTAWFAKRVQGTRASAFIYELFLAPEVRGKGFGKTVMALIEDEVRKVGLKSIGLHVFGHNEVAIRLYEKTGYKTVDLIMSKDL